MSPFLADFLAESTPGGLTLVLALGMALAVLLAAAVVLGASRQERTFGPGATGGRTGTVASVFFFDDQRLVSAPGEWRDLLDGEGHEGSDWDLFRAQMAPRFPDLPDAPRLPAETAMVSLSSRFRSDPATLRLRNVGTGLRVTLREDAPACAVHRHTAQTAQFRLKAESQVIDTLPVAVWSMDTSGHITRRNAAYRALEDELSGTTELTAPLSRQAAGSESRRELTYRVMLDPRGRVPARWFDVTARRSDTGWQCHAQDVSAQVRAELAQRNFVQTLTKTFAQLSTGLAIFDKDRQLMLFNPALVDLTNLSPEFLTSRPALSVFFDNLRERQIMPEPKNYASWRERLNAVVSAAANGRYQETWSLPSGATYRVTGRPHPNGAVAFLIEDITDEVSLTRRFRQQLSLSQSVLDAMTDAIVIFDAQGLMSYCNAAYRQLFALEDDTDFTTIAVRDAHRMWSRRAVAPDGLQDLLGHLVVRQDRSPSELELVLKGVGAVRCAVLPLVAGACMVTFGQARHQPSLPSQPREPAEPTEAAE